jgi:sigma-E factor negative regulatory protein RseA
MKEKLSAMMDDALADGERESCVRRLKEDDDLRTAWDVYHLIGDALRGHTGPHVAERVRERLAVEPTVLAPQRREGVRPRLAWYPLAAAASVAAVALVGWLALPLFDLQGGTGTQTVASVVEPAPAPVPVLVPPAQGVADYLLAHQRFSPAIAMSGLAPYVRTVAEEAGSR